MDSTSLGSVHGFAVQSESSFVYLRDGCGEPLMIREDGSEPSHPGDCLADIKSRNALPTRVYRRDGRFSVRMDGVGWFGIDPGTLTITVPPTQYHAWLEGAIWGLRWRCWYCRAVECSFTRPPSRSTAGRSYSLVRAVMG